MRYLIIINIILVTFLIKLFKKNKKLFAQYGAAKEMKLHYFDLYQTYQDICLEKNNQLHDIKKIIK